MFITRKTTTLILAFSLIFANFLFPNSLSIAENGDGTWNVNYSSDSDIGGFQFNTEGATIVDASGGDAAGNGFTVSTSATTVLGFSLSGSTIPANDGILLVLSVDGNLSGLSSIVVSDPSGSNLDFTFDSGDDAVEPDHVVEVGGGLNQFSPQDLSIEVGETVQWVNLSGFHNVNGSTDTFPNNPASFSSGASSSDAWTYSFTFDIEGVYNYQCDPHAGMGMTGTIVVSSGSGPPECVLDCPGWALVDGSCEEFGGTDESDECMNNACSEMVNWTDCWTDCSPEVLCEIPVELFASACVDCLADGDCNAEWGSSGLCAAGADAWAAGCNIDDFDLGCSGSDDGGGEGVIGDEPNSLWLVENGDGSWSIGFNSSDNIGGFQLNIDGASINGASGGAATDAGFMLSTSTTTILGFSLSGATIPSQEDGILIDLDLDGVPSGISGIVVSDPAGSDLGFTYDDGSVTVYCEDISACNYNEEGDCIYAEQNFDCDGNCIVGEDCFGECGGDAVEDECGECDGSGASFQCWDGSVECSEADCPDEPEDLIELSFQNIDTSSGTLDVYMTNTSPVAGFQVELSGLNITGASGGSAADAGFTVSTGSTTLLGFSLTG